MLFFPLQGLGGALSLSFRAGPRAHCDSEAIPVHICFLIEALVRRETPEAAVSLPSPLMQGELCGL